VRRFALPADRLRQAGQRRLGHRRLVDGGHLVGEGLCRRHRRRLRALRIAEREGRDRRLRHRRRRAVAAKAGIEVKFVNTPWEGIFNALKQGDRDLLVSSITITDERKQSMDFSDPYFDAHQLIAVKADSKIAHFEDLKSLKVGVQTGTTGDETISKLQGKNSADIKRFESTPLALKELETGGIDAVVADNGVVVNYVKNNSGNKFKTVNDPAFAPEHYGIAVRKGNAELLAKLNQGLAAIKADGSYDRIYATYLGTPDPAAAAASPPASAASK
jgi:polar amino acid transport system substrate-binding protein